MPFSYDPKLIPRARELRKEATPQERKLWYGFLNNYPIRFQRQKAIRSYIVDFYCHKAKLVIELDGDQHGTPEQLTYDLHRTEVLESIGLSVIRFTNAEVRSSFDAVCDAINRAVKRRLSENDALVFQAPKTEFDDSE